MSYTTSATIAQVKTEAPINSAQISATSYVSDDDLTRWIGEAEAELSVLSDAHNVTLDDASVVKIADRGVKAYAIAKLLRTMGNEEQSGPYWTEWREVRELVELRVQMLGDDYVATTGLPTNVDTSDPKKRRWIARDDDRGDGWTGW